MLFSKEMLADEDWDETVYTKIISHGRWSVGYETVFRQDGRFFRTRFRVGATESQDEAPYQDEPEEIECPEVFPVEVTTVEYREQS